MVLTGNVSKLYILGARSLQPHTYSFILIILLVHIFKLSATAPTGVWLSLDPDFTPTSDYSGQWNSTHMSL